MTSENPSEEERGESLVSLTPVRVARLGELNAYIVYEYQLDALEKLDEELTKDPPDSVFLNFALFLLPISLSFLIALLTTTIHSNRVYEAFVIVCLVTFILSLLLFALWRRDRRSYRLSRARLLESRRKQIEQIRNKLPPNPGGQVSSSGE